MVDNIIKENEVFSYSFTKEGKTFSARLVISKDSLNKGDIKKHLVVVAETIASGLLRDAQIAYTGSSDADDVFTKLEEIKP